MWYYCDHGVEDEKTLALLLWPLFRLSKQCNSCHEVQQHGPKHNSELPQIVIMLV